MTEFVEAVARATGTPYETAIEIYNAYVAREFPLEPEPTNERELVSHG